MAVSMVRLYNAKGPDRLAVVAVEPSSGSTAGFLIRLARGSGPGPLQKGSVFGPFAEPEVEVRFAEILATLKAEGFLPTGVPDLLVKLESTHSAVRARAAVALGWRRATEAVELILARLPKAVDEVCSFLDALGMLGDARAITVLREQAGRKLLSRRRSAVEAIRNIGDPDSLALARQQALERLPASVRQALDSDNVASIVQAVESLEAVQRGLALDTLYEIASPSAIEATRSALEKGSFDQPHVWRYVKSIHKRAMLRHDYVTLGWLNHQIEKQAKDSEGTKATVKSGYDGVSRPVHIFGRSTQNYMRRLSWRYLRQIACHRPEAYAFAAAEAVAAFDSDDETQPQGYFGAFANCYLLHRILWGASDRFHLNKRSLRFRFLSSKSTAPLPTRREEAYPHLWDAQPRAYLRLLGAAKLPEAHEFALRALETRHSVVLQQASLAEVLALLHAPYEATVRLGLNELRRRFDPQHPDWTLLEQLLKDERSIALELGEGWLRDTAPLWTADIEQCMRWLSAPNPSTRLLAADLVQPCLAGNASMRLALAARILPMFLDGLLADDAANGVAEVARNLLDELAPMLTLPQLLDWIGKGPAATLAVAGELLGRRSEPLQSLDLNLIALLAQHDIVAIRTGAHRLLRRGETVLAADPSVLFVLVESTWGDTRTLALDLMRNIIRPESLEFEALIGLLDSSQVDVQEFAIDLTRRHLSILPASRIVFRLVQHSHRNMRPFALELAQQYLPEGAEPLARLDTFFRSVFFDLRPDRKLKYDALGFLIERGLCDELQARVVMPILSDLVRVQGRGDFERALEGLARLKLAFPETPAPVHIAAEGVE